MPAMHRAEGRPASYHLCCGGCRSREGRRVAKLVPSSLPCLWSSQLCRYELPPAGSFSPPRPAAGYMELLSSSSWKKGKQSHPHPDASSKDQGDRA